MVSIGAVVIGFIALMGLFTFGAADGEKYELRMVEIEQVEEASVEE